MSQNTTTIKSHLSPHKPAELGLVNSNPSDKATESQGSIATDLRSHNTSCKAYVQCTVPCLLALPACGPPALPEGIGNKDPRMVHVTSALFPTTSLFWRWKLRDYSVPPPTGSGAVSCGGCPCGDHAQCPGGAAYTAPQRDHPALTWPIFLLLPARFALWPEGSCWASLDQ